MEKSKYEKKEQEFFKILLKKLEEQTDINEIIDINKSLSDTLLNIAAEKRHELYWFGDLYGLIKLNGIITDAISESLDSYIYPKEKAPVETKRTEAMN